MPRDPQSRMAIGQSLIEARRRLGMEIAEAEEQTKIRAKYIRAMESEEWEVLPGATYTRAFIRTYAQILGLDGEMLADQYRRAYDEPATTGISTEPLLEQRRSPGQRPASRGPLIVVLGVTLLVVLLLLGIFGGDDEGGEGGQAPKNGGKRASTAGGPADQAEPISIRLLAESGTRVCVVGDQGALIDAQLIAAGAEESFSNSESYRVDVEAGALTISSEGHQRQVQTDDPASFAVGPRGIQEVPYAGPGCQ